jgi:hypothetical protein
MSYFTDFAALVQGLRFLSQRHEGARAGGGLAVALLAARVPMRAFTALHPSGAAALMQRTGSTRAVENAQIWGSTDP